MISADLEMDPDLPMTCLKHLLSSLALVWAFGSAHAADAAPNCVAKHTGLFTHPPRQVPTRGMPDGPLLGNGDVGVTLAGPPEAQAFYLGKNDFWTRHRGDAKVINVGRLELSIPALQGASYRQEQDLARAEVRGTFTKGDVTVRTRSWVDANTNLLLTELHCEGGEPPKVSVRVASGVDGDVPAQVRAYVDDQPAVSRGSRVAVSAGFTRRADDLPGPAREVAVRLRAVGADGLDFVLKPGAPVTLATSILSDSDAENPTTAATQLVSGLTPARIAARLVQHRAWWSDFWARSYIEIPDQEIEKRWYGALYVMGSCSRPGDVAPGLWGNWLTTDQPNWHGDFHLNYNFQAPFYIVYGANHADLSLPFYQAIRESLPNGRAMARRHGWQGVHFPVSIGPWGLSPEDPDGDWGQRSNAAYVALNFIWYWQYTQDVAWLRTSGYPYVREVAAFWEDYLRFEQGRYVIENDAIHEGSGDNLNPILSLGLVRTLFHNLLEMSRELGADADQRSKWREILDQLSAFPTQERDGKTVFRYTERGPAWWNDNTLGIQHIFPAGAIGLDSDPQLLQVCHNTIEAMHRWHDGNGFSSWYTACARVGYDPRTILAKLREECDRCSMPNLLLTYGGGGIENVAGFLALNEMLLQSHEGVIRFFPVWPREQNARFGSLRAVGAFLVTAELKEGTVRAVSIQSEKGRACTVQNPWPGRNVQLIRNGRPAETTGGDRFTLPTAVGEIIELQEAD